MSILYEVTLHIDASLADSYDHWLHQHMDDMLALPGFDSAAVHAVEADPEHAETFSRVVHYQLADRASFDAYLHNHAQRMREEGMKRFGNRVRANRRILLPMDD
jgi:uncharacterized protein YcbX